MVWRRYRNLFCQIYIFIYLIGFCVSIKWLGLSNVNIADQAGQVFHESERAMTRAGLVRRQQKIISKDEGLADVVYMTAKSVAAACQSSFNESRWNCSSITKLPTVTPELNAGTREQAYLYALASSQIAVGVAKGCAKGNIRSCTCRTKQQVSPSLEDHAPNVSALYHERGCGVNLKFGLKFSERFTDAPYKKYKKVVRKRLYLPKTEKDKEAMMNIHNSKTGRQAVKKALITKCKCHGLSGSCEIKTCWNDLDNTKLLSDLLQMYKTALPAVQYDGRQAKGIASSTHYKREADGGSGRMSSLVFLSMSSDYCEVDTRHGSYGTRGRKCGDEYNNRTCDSMCCGRGHIQVLHTKTNNRCNCKHIWCCYVKCDTCKVDITEYYCR